MESLPFLLPCRFTKGLPAVGQDHGSSTKRWFYPTGFDLRRQSLWAFLPNVLQSLLSFHLASAHQSRRHVWSQTTATVLPSWRSFCSQERWAASAVRTVSTLPSHLDSFSWPASLSSRGSQPPLQSHTGPQPPLLAARTEAPRHLPCRALRGPRTPCGAHRFARNPPRPSYPFTLCVAALPPSIRSRMGAHFPTDGPRHPQPPH